MSEKPSLRTSVCDVLWKPLDSIFTGPVHPLYVQVCPIMGPNPSFYKWISTTSYKHHQSLGNREKIICLPKKICTHKTYKQVLDDKQQWLRSMMASATVLVARSVYMEIIYWSHEFLFQTKYIYIHEMVPVDLHAGCCT